MFIFGGCVNSDEPIPTIVYGPPDQGRVTPNPPTEVTTARRTGDKNIPSSWIPLGGYSDTSFRHFKWECGHI
jgi:hypothetical protein